MGSINFWKCFIIFFFLLLSTRAALQAQEEEVNRSYEEIKLNLLCKSVRVIISRYEHINREPEEAIDCYDLEAIRASIPTDFQKATIFFNLFAPKTYEDFGKNKLEARLNKLVDDLNTELNQLYNDRAWRQNMEAFQLELKSSKDVLLKQARENPDKRPEAETKPLDKSNVQSIPISDKEETPMIIYFVLLLMIACLAYLVWQLQVFKRDLSDSIDTFQERYSRLDNRQDTFVSHKDYQSLLLKFNFLNEQLNVLVQEISVLKNRNEHKMSAEELLAKRTEHLETYSFNPQVQIYYARANPDRSVIPLENLKTEPSKEAYLKMEIDLENPNQAVFGIVDRSEYHHLALKHSESLLAPYCEYANDPYNDSRIITLEKGLIEKKDKYWQVLLKAKIAFE